MGVGAKVIDSADDVGPGVVGCAVGAGVDSQLPSSATRTEISSPTRLQALMFEAARRPQHVLSWGCDPSSCAPWGGSTQRVDAQLYWKLGSSHGDGEHSPLLLKKND